MSVWEWEESKEMLHRISGAMEEMKELILDALCMLMFGVLFYVTAVLVLSM